MFRTIKNVGKNKDHFISFVTPFPLHYSLTHLATQHNMRTCKQVQTFDLKLFIHCQQLKFLNEHDGNWNRHILLVPCDSPFYDTFWFTNILLNNEQLTACQMVIDNKKSLIVKCSYSLP